MNELADDRPKAPKPPSVGLLVAVGLEAAIVAAFIAERSIIGLLLCLSYAWYSATWALMFRLD